jgi:RNA polymerase sigma factor (sigma-70 family)
VAVDIIPARAAAQDSSRAESMGALIDLEGLYRAHARDLYRFALLLSGRHDQAEDLVSETFIRLWNARQRVDLTTVRAYLFTIARNLHLQQLRQKRRGADLDLDVPDPEPGPDRQAGARHELEAVLGARCSSSRSSIGRRC